MGRDWRNLRIGSLDRRESMAGKKGKEVHVKNFQKEYHAYPIPFTKKENKT